MTKIMPVNKKNTKRSKKSPSPNQPRETQETLEKAFSEAIATKSKNEVSTVERWVLGQFSACQYFGPMLTTIPLNCDNYWLDLKAF